jgi:murein DD-endopeptidase MepM/ murein hydrolase activator NlpD
MTKLSKILKCSLAILAGLLYFTASAQAVLLTANANEAVGPVKRYSKVKQGEGLYQALKRVGIENKLALALINTLRDEVEFSKLKVGDQLVATFKHEGEEKKLIKFSFAQNAYQKHYALLNKETGEWDYKFKEELTYWQPRILSGELKTFLHQDLHDYGLSSAVVNEIVNVLLCQVNFRMNARKGDKFKVLLNERIYLGQVVQTKILSTEYQGVRAGYHQAFYYVDAEKSSTYTAHYAENGQALIRSGLRYPLSSLHVRSGYGWRRHPVTGRKAMHRGVDLRARKGTPVHAVADGTVIMSSSDPYAGNKIGIRHRDGSSSYYFHLNKRSVRKGAWVRSYQVIGTVGRTGRVTGPHLHFGFKKRNGRWMNPLNKRMIATPKLKGKRFSALQEQIHIIKGLLTDLEISEEAKYLVAKFPGTRHKYDISPFLFKL